MKNKIVIGFMVVAFAALGSACGQSSKAPAASAASAEAAIDTAAKAASEMMAETAQAAAASTEEQTVIGTIDEIKDFMVSIVSEDGNPYTLNYDKMPEGLDKMKPGDKVEIVYTGELTEVDAFNGSIISVTAVK